MTPGSPRTASARRASSASTPGRWARSATVRSRSRCTPSAQRARCRWGSGCICPRTGVRTPSGGGRPRFPPMSSSRPSRRWVAIGRARGGLEDPPRPGAGRPGLRQRRQAADPPARRRHRLRAVDRPGMRRLRARHRVRGPAAQARLARPRAQRAGHRHRAAVDRRARRRPGRRRLADGRLPRHRRRADRLALRVRARDRRAPRRPRPPGATRGMADRRMARRPRRSRPTTGSATCPPTPSPSASRAWPGCAG